MYNPKVLSIFNNLEKQSFNICQEIDAFMGNILNWADELGGIVEKEFTASKTSTVFLLPKTPSEKKTRHRKGRNALLSNCSVINSTFLQNETTNLDETTSKRTRGAAKRAATSKISQLNDVSHKLPEESSVETAVTEKNTIDVSNATFVLPKASTRTKPVLKTKQPEPLIAVTNKKETTPKGLSTYIVVNETLESINSEETTSAIGDKDLRLTKTSMSTVNGEQTHVSNEQDNVDMEMDENLISSTRIVDVMEHSGNAQNGTEEVSPDVEVPNKKGELVKDEEIKENLEEVADTETVADIEGMADTEGMADPEEMTDTEKMIDTKEMADAEEMTGSDTMRITRTKSKAIKKMMEENETKQADLSAFAKKLLNRAKLTSLKKNQLAALLECNTSTPTNGPGQLGNLPFGNLTTSKSKYHLLLSGSKKLKTPLATLPNSAIKIAKASEDKNRAKPKVVGRDSSVENLRSVTKPTKDELEKEIKLKSKKEKEEGAALKRQNVIRTKQEELKRKNELKHQMAMKQREKLEQEKYHNMIQSEKEKEERHKLILQERQIKLKEETFKKKMLTQQKIAETVERRRLEEEARLAKLREMEAEEQRLALEKQKEQERQEKRAQERLAQKKAREEYELQLKQELEAERLRAEKILTAKKCLPSASKLQSSSKRQKFGLIGEAKREWDYKPRNENDYGLEDEHSEVDSEDEKSYDKSKPAVPWGKKVMYGKSPIVKVLTLEMLCEFMPCYQKSPDIYKMFRMTPSKRIKRSSSAIWNTPSS